MARGYELGIQRTRSHGCIKFAPGRVHFDLSETDDNDVEILHDSSSADFRRDPRELGLL